MKSNKDSSSDYIVYIRYSSSSASSPAPMSSASPTAAAAIGRNALIVYETVTVSHELGTLQDSHGDTSPLIG